VTGKYRPVNMNQHVDFVQYFNPSIKDPQPTNPAQAMADDIEEKWAKATNACRQVLTTSNMSRYSD
jgi:hypothetical protein